MLEFFYFNIPASIALVLFSLDLFPFPQPLLPFFPSPSLLFPSLPSFPPSLLFSVSPPPFLSSFFFSHHFIILRTQGLVHIIYDSHSSWSA